MRHVFKLCLLACAAAMPLAVQAADLTVRTRHVTAAEQQQAIFDCQYEMGMHGAPKIQAYHTRGQTVLRILPNGHVDAHAAARISACADARLGRSTTVVRANPLQVRKTAVGACPSWASVLYRGTGYCVGN